MTPTASLKTSPKCLYERHLIFRLFGGGAAPLITQEIILCQSLMPHVECVMLNRRDGLFGRITSKIEGGASFMEHVGWGLDKICKIKNIIYRMQRLGFVRFHQVIVQISNDNYIVEMNMNVINTRSKIINKTNIRHRRWPIDADNRPFAATNRCFNCNAFYML